MTELHGKAEATEVGKPEVATFKEIKPQSDMTLLEAKSFVDSLFKETDNLSNDKPMLGEDSACDSQDDVQDELNIKDTEGKLEGIKRETNKEGLTDEEKEKIKEETGWSDEIIDAIGSMEEYNIYKNAGLIEKEIDGKKCLIRSDIDLDQKDEFGRTNRERMANGNHPIAKNGETVELHHIGQKSDSPLAELTTQEHRGEGNNTILHDKNKKSEIDRGVFNNERRAHWKASI